MASRSQALARTWVWPALLLATCATPGPAPTTLAVADASQDGAGEPQPVADAATDAPRPAGDVTADALEDAPADAAPGPADAGTADLATADDGPEVGAADGAADGTDSDADEDADAGAPTPADADAGGADAADVPPTPPPVWDAALVQDAATAACTFSQPHTVLEDGGLVQAWQVSYLSWESVDGKLVPILIRGYAARPAGGAAVLPGVVQAHGLGGHAEEKHATALAARLGMFVVAYTGPGGGTVPENTSQGLPSGAKNGYRMFDVLQDVRGSWFWGHATAAMRAVTCLANRPDVDAKRLGITGFSAGGVVSLLVAGADDRVGAAVPLSGTLAWSVAVQAPQAWQHELLTVAGLSTASPEWQKLQAELIEPTVALTQAKAKVLMVNGTTDEFFPLTAHLATFAALPGGDKRTSLAGNFDHGCYAISGGESAKTIEERAALRAEGGQRLWFRHWFQTDPTYAYLPQAPQASAQAVGGATLLAAVVDPGGPQLQVEHVRFWWSQDDAFLFAYVDLEGKNGTWSKLVPAPLAPNAVWFVDVQYKTKGLLPQRFSLSSAPVIPAGLVPHVRSIKTCL